MLSETFTDKQHEKGYKEALLRTGKSNSHEYRCAIYALSSHDDLRTKALPFVTQDGIKWAEIESQDFSEGHRFILRATENLFRGQGSVDLSDILLLDATMFNVLVTSMAVLVMGDGE